MPSVVPPHTGGMYLRATGHHYLQTISISSTPPAASHLRHLPPSVDASIDQAINIKQAINQRPSSTIDNQSINQSINPTRAAAARGSSSCIIRVRRDQALQFNIKPPQRQSSANRPPVPMLVSLHPRRSPNTHATPHAHTGIRTHRSPDMRTY